MSRSRRKMHGPLTVTVSMVALTASFVIGGSAEHAGATPPADTCAAALIGATLNGSDLCELTIAGGQVTRSQNFSLPAAVTSVTVQAVSGLPSGESDVTPGRSESMTFSVATTPSTVLSVKLTSWGTNIFCSDGTPLDNGGRASITSNEGLSAVAGVGGNGGCDSAGVGTVGGNGGDAGNLSAGSSPIEADGSAGSASVSGNTSNWPDAQPGGGGNGRGWGCRWHERSRQRIRWKPGHRRRGR